MSAIVINPLSCAKGKKFTCEMCGKAATLACQHCRVTYYCAKEHMSVDWFGIHEKVCQLLGALRTLRPTLGSEDERQRRNLTVQMSQHALIDLWYVDACRIHRSKQNGSNDRVSGPMFRRKLIGLFLLYFVVCFVSETNYSPSAKTRLRSTW
jgi:hypothetical protein